MAKSGKSDVEVEQRLKAMLKGAFAGAPTQLKDIPKKKPPSQGRKTQKRAQA